MATIIIWNWLDNGQLRWDEESEKRQLKEKVFRDEEDFLKLASSMVNKGTTLLYRIEQI